MQASKTKYPEKTIEEMRRAVEDEGLSYPQVSARFAVPVSTVKNYAKFQGWHYTAMRGPKDMQNRLEKLGGRIGALTKQKNRLERENEDLRGQVARLTARLESLTTDRLKPPTKRDGLFGRFLALIG